jgi:hypothetical protein
MKSALCKFGILVLSLLAGVESWANVVTNVPVADTALRDNSPDLNQETVTPLPVGDSQSGSVHNRGLFMFDLSDVPTNAVVKAVILRFTVVQSGTLDSSFDVNRVLVQWGETNATWNNRLDAVPWKQPGAQPGTDYIQAASDTAILRNPGVSTDFTNLISDVQMWVDNPATNFGWILIVTGDAPATGKQIGARKDSVNTPLLIVEFTIPTAPVTPVLTGIAQVGNQFQFFFNAESNHTYAAQFVGSLLDTNWVVLTNIPPQPAAIPVSIATH